MTLATQCVANKDHTCQFSILYANHIDIGLSSAQPAYNLAIEILVKQKSYHLLSRCCS